MKITFSLIKQFPLLAYSTARCAHFTLQYLMLQSVQKTLQLLNALPRSQDVKNPTLMLHVHRDLLQFMQKDVANISSNVYPASVLTPESPLKHALRFPQIIADAWSIQKRKNRGRTTEFEAKAHDYLSEMPRYYRRNFHFQTDGYLSEKSARLYEHQVEMLFHGAADAMRRLIVSALRKRYGSSDGRGLRFLEIAAGTGRTTRFVHLAFPKAKIIATDLSDPYLQVARQKLVGFDKIDFVQAAGERLPFTDGYFDAVYSVFLFHELPLEARKDVLKETARVLNPGGFFGLVDSLQLHDAENFAPLLQNFHHEFHEPFYRNYIENPMEDLVKNIDSHFTDIESSRGFLSKLLVARRSFN